MTMKKVEISIPESIEQYTVLTDRNELSIRNAMLVYPFIKNGTISHGRAAEMLGMRKIDLIQLYGNMGLPYLDESAEELEEELAVLKEFRSVKAC